jgi:simple sugar transport system permease protein
MRDPYFSIQASYTFPGEVILPVIIPGTRLTTSVVVVMVCVFLTYVFMRRTKFGHEAALIRDNHEFAKYAGINIAAVALLVQFLGGALAGMGGALEMYGRNTRFTWNVLPGRGWDGFMIATLARGNPWFVPVSALFLSYLRIGADIMNRNADVDNELVTVVMSIMILLVASKGLLAGTHRKIVLRRAGGKRGTV